MPNKISHFGLSVSSFYYRRVPKTAYTQASDIFRELLRDARVAKGLTQADVAKRLGFPQSYVSKYESGERRLDFVETAKVCEVLGMEIEQFAAAFTEKLAKERGSKGS